ncbi:tyrosinase family protein [Streptomyces iconiensis]|uniref:Tyrosinase family protein n=1 Tax=Streptomyces iconiensis TaxID=1384038 RepID=A0ABT7A7R5_9ACTN|nr:tyrosinase family protein [Streptomyces iconiensis]MDJ1137112.1 tyrosinase family protein [Streptomyces iconiensis]
MGSSFKRRDVAGMVNPTTGAWDPVLYWYARAVGEMKKKDRSASDSWLFQAFTHGVPKSEGVRPTDPDEWRQCPHGNQYFLPWHRWHVYYFERIVRRVIVKDLGQRDQAHWTLPYWNYAHLDAAFDPLLGGAQSAEEYRRIPLALRQERMRDPRGQEEGPNPLYLKPHDANGRCRGAEPMTYDQVDPAAAMRERHFEPVDRRAVSGFSAVLERWPHGNVHTAVGGLMGKVPTAGQDPVFWLHHCNIDRLWYAWLSRGHTLPTGWQWPAVRPQHAEHEHGKDLPFVLRDENGGQHRFTGPVFTFPEDAYEYESLTDGTGSDAPPKARLGVVPPVGAVLVAGTDEETALGAGQLALDLVPEAGREEAIGSALEGNAGEDGSSLVLLTFEGVRADAPPCTNFRVFLGDDTRDTNPCGDAFVGLLTFFGAVGEDAEMTEDGAGLTFRFDVTETLRDLRGGSAWSGAGVPTVRIAPAEEPSFEGVNARFSRASFTVT